MLICKCDSFYHAFNVDTFIQTLMNARRTWTIAIQLMLTAKTILEAFHVHVTVVIVVMELTASVSIRALFFIFF